MPWHKCCLDLCPRSCPIEEFYGLRSHLEVCHPFWLYVSWRPVEIFRSLCCPCGCPVLPATHVEEILLLLYTGTFYVVNSLTISAWVYFGVMSGISVLFHWALCLLLCQYHAVWISVALQFGLKSRRVVASTLFFVSFFPMFALAILGLVWLPVNFRNICTCLRKRCFARVCLQSVDCFRQYDHLNNIKSSSSRACDIFIFLLSSFIAFVSILVFRIQVFLLWVSFILRYLILFMGLVLAFLLIGLYMAFFFSYVPFPLSEYLLPV